MKNPDISYVLLKNEEKRTVAAVTALFCSQSRVVVYLHHVFLVYGSRWRKFVIYKPVVN